jgi:hypothetical protein
MGTTIQSGLSEGKAVRMMAALCEGRTLRTFGVRAPRLEAYFKAHPEYAREARPLIEANKEAARLRKGARLRDRTQCKYGHSLEGARVYMKDGYKFRFCVECRKVDDAKGGILKPEVGAKIKAALKSPMATINGITHAGPRRLVSHVALQAYRRADPEIDLLVRGIISTAHSRSQKFRWQRFRNEAKREETNDYHKILAMLPAAFPDKDDVVSDIFEALVNGSLRREDVQTRVRQFITAHNRMFPTDFAKFGDSKLVSLDEVLFDDGTMTRGDTVTRRLWD